MKESRRRVYDNGIYTERWAKGALGRQKSLNSTATLVQAVLPFVPYSFVDIGAGIGTCVRLLRAAGKIGYGIDGIANVEAISGALVHWADLSEPLPLCFDPAYTAISIEVGEHIPPDCAQVFLDNLTGMARKTLVLSWAPVHRAGTGHVNCQDAPWVHDQLDLRGFYVDVSATRDLQRTAGRGWGGKLWVARRASGRC